MAGVNDTGSSKRLMQVSDIVRQRIRKAARALQGPRAPSDDAVHYARKQLKRARAGLRLVRDAVPKAAYARENVALRDAARPLSVVRDARVMLDTLERLRASSATHAGRALQHALRGERLSLRREILQHRANRQRVVRELVRADRRIGRWRPHGKRRVLKTGIRRLFRRGRRAMTQASADRSVDSLHELRKQVKYLGLALEALDVRDVKQPAKAADEIADRLGDVHDLAVLREKISALSPAVQEVPARLFSRIERRSARLEKKAMKRARSLYRSKPGKFVGRYL